MTLRECYEKMNGNIEEAQNRFNKAEKIIKYLRIFEKSPDFEEFCNAMENEDWETAFRNVHNIKGMALNLNLTKLAEVSTGLCDGLRNGAPKEEINSLKEKFKSEYVFVMDAIAKLDD